MTAAICVNTLLSTLDAQFVEIDRRSRELLERVRDEDIYRPSGRSNDAGPSSLGEYILRSAAAVEQAAGGITTRLWDDPFEWTLPEKLSTRALIVEYLDEVEKTRRRAFRAIDTDADLCRQIPAPENLRTLFQILVEAATQASHFQGRAFTVLQVVSGEKPPRLRPTD